MQNTPISPSTSVNQGTFLGFSRSNPPTPTLRPVDLSLDDLERFSLYDSIPPISAIPDLLVNTYSWSRPVVRPNHCHRNNDNRGGRSFGSNNMAYC
jgi:hypothetical protein